MLTPATQDLTCYIGGTWDQEFVFWDNVGETEAHDFTGWTLSMKIVMPGSSSSLFPTVNLSGNSLVCSLTELQTTTLIPGTGHYVLSMSDTSTPPNIEFLLHGNFTTVAP